MIDFIEIFLVIQFIAIHFTTFVSKSHGYAMVKSGVKLKRHMGHFSYYSIEVIYSRCVN